MIRCLPDVKYTCISILFPPYLFTLKQITYNLLIEEKSKIVLFFCGRIIIMGR